MAGIVDTDVATLTYTIDPDRVTNMIKTPNHSPERGLRALKDTAQHSGRSVAGVVREAVRRVWLCPPLDGPVTLWDGVPNRTSIEHDAIYDER